MKQAIFDLIFGRYAEVAREERGKAAESVWSGCTCVHVQGCALALRPELVNGHEPIVVELMGG